MASADTVIARLLNGLCESSREGLFNLMCSQRQLVRIKHYDDEMLPCYVALGAGRQDGERWADWATCEVWGETQRRSEESTDHPRWQINFHAGSVDVKTPQKPVKGMPPAGQQVKGILELKEWQNWKHAASTGSKRPNLKLQAHHVAYAASHRFQLKQLPANLGKGSSVSHTCDQRGCITLGHLLVEDEHIDNMARQRCPGVVLTVLDGVIITEEPCAHATKIGDVVDILTSCAKVKTIQLPHLLLEVKTEFHNAFQTARELHLSLLDRKKKKRRLSDVYGSV